MKTILIVDDDKQICDILKLLIETQNYQVDTASSGDSAFELLQKKQYDILISDVRMPDGDGIELLKKTLEKFPEIKVILMSGYMDHTEEELIAMGADAFLKKPEIIHTIKDYL